MVSDLWLDCFLRPPGFGGGGPGPGPGDDGGPVCVGSECEPPGGCEEEIFWYCDPDNPILNCQTRPFTWEEAGKGKEDDCRFLDEITIGDITYYNEQADCIQNNNQCKDFWTPGGATPPGPSTPPGGSDLNPCLAYICINPESGQCDGISLQSNHPCYDVLWGKIIGCIPTGVISCTDQGVTYWPHANKDMCDIDCYEDDNNPNTPGDCWRCPPSTQGQQQQCCNRDAPQINTGNGWECPAGTTITKKDCDDECLQGCWFCDDESQECEYKQVECGKSCIQLGGYKQWAQCSINCEGVKADCFECLVPGECCSQTCKRKKQGQGDCPSQCYEFAGGEGGCNETCGHKCWQCVGEDCTQTLDVDCGIKCGDPGAGYANAGCNGECDDDPTCYSCLNPGPETCCEVNPLCTGSVCNTSLGCYANPQNCATGLTGCFYGCIGCNANGDCFDDLVNQPCKTSCEYTSISQCEADPACQCTQTCYNCQDCGTGSNACTGGGCISVGEFDCTNPEGDPVDCTFYGHLNNSNCDGSCPDCTQECYGCVVNTGGGGSTCTSKGSISCKGSDGSPQTCTDYNTQWYNDSDCNGNCITTCTCYTCNGSFCQGSDGWDCERTCEQQDAFSSDECGAGCGGGGTGCEITCYDCDPANPTACISMGKYNCDDDQTCAYYDLQEKDCPDGAGGTTCTDSCTMECWNCVDIAGFEVCQSAGSYSCDNGETCDSYSSPDNVLYDNAQCTIDGAFQCDTGGGVPPPFDGDVPANSLAYAFDIVDPLYERNVNNRKYGLNNPPFQGVERGGLPERLFAPTVHASIVAVNNINNTDSLFSDYPYTNLSNDHIEKSLSKYVRQLINTTYLATGEPIKAQVLQTIRQLIISNRIDAIDSTVFISYLESIKEQQSNYPDTRGAGIAYTRGSSMAEAAAVRLASENNWPLEASEYEGTTVEKMKVWKTMATDLSKYLPITTSEGVTHKFYYNDSDQMTLAATGTLSMSVGDVQKITDSAGGITEIPVLGNYSRARILDLEYLQRIIYLLGEDYNFTLNVATDDELRVDERYGVDEAREDYYFLKLDTDHITSQQQEHSLVSVTKSKYTYLTSTSDISDWLEFRPWPYMTFYVDDTDPIFKYITNASGDGDVYLTTKDFTLNLFEGNENIPIYLRRVLQYIILIPTNLDNKVHNHQISTQKSYGERELTFTVNPLPSTVASFDNSATMPHLKESFTYPSEGVSQRGTTKDSVSYELDTETLDEVPKYLSGAPILPYPSYGMKQVLAAIKEYKDDYYAPDGTVGWNEIYAKVDRGKMKYLYNEAFNWPRTRSLLNLGKVSTNDEVNSNYLKTRDIPSDNKKITDPTFDSDSVRLEKRPESSLPTPPAPIE